MKGLQYFFMLMATFFFGAVSVEAFGGGTISEVIIYGIIVIINYLLWIFLMFKEGERV